MTILCIVLAPAGIDFKGVQMVINYDLPLTAVAYIHRIGKLRNSCLYFLFVYSIRNIM